MSEKPPSWGRPPDFPQSWGTPPPPQQPTWRQPGSTPQAPPPAASAHGLPPSPSRRKLPWILGAAGVVLVLVVVGLVLLLRGDGADTNDPESAAKSFVAAAKDGDCEAYTATTTQRFQDTYGRCEGDLDTAALLGSSGLAIDGDVSVTEETDETATAEVQVSYAGFSLPLQLQMVRDDRGWLVDDLTIAGFGLDDIPGDPGQLPN